MSAKSDFFDNALLKLLLNATPISFIADNAATSPITTLTVALHTANPGSGGDQTTSEATYTGYARVTVARTTGGWTVTGNSVSPVANIDFGERTDSGSAQVITHVSIGTGHNDKMLWFGALTPTISITQGIIPRLKTTSTLTES